MKVELIVDNGPVRRSAKTHWDVATSNHRVFEINQRPPGGKALGGLLIVTVVGVVAWFLQPHGHSGPA